MQSQDHQEMLNNESHQQPPLQDRRLKSMTGGDSSQAASQQHPPQKCPRCESMNTKFCYYNNYSLTQPRYFCKTCRRYWTQGGTLRNVPVGGGCRKGKRSKTTSSSNTATSAATAASSSLSQAQPQQQQNMITSNPAAAVSSMGMGQFYPGGDFLSSLAAAQPSNQQRGFSSGDLAGPSNLSLLQGYAALQFSQAFHQTQAQLFHFGNRDKGSSEMEDALYTSSPERLIQAGNSQTHQQNWLNQSLFSNPSAVSDGTNVWTIESTTAKNTSTTTAVTSSASMNPNQWPDLPGFGGRP